MCDSSLLVIGFGNELRRDDGIGVEVIRELRRLGRQRPGVDLVDGGVRGIDLIDRLQRYDHAILIDALLDEAGPPGEVIEADLERAKILLEPIVSLHHLDLGTALELARVLDIELPPLDFVLLRVAEVGPGEGLTGMARDALPGMVRAVDKKIARLLGHTEITN